jgi:hypothetical protein
MDEPQREAAFLQALNTEHFVLQTATGVAVSEQASRASAYLLSLSSSLVGLGFASQSREAFVPFLATVLPAIFILGLITAARLVDISVESYEFLAGIARIRRYYRTLTPKAAELFDKESGRWPEERAKSRFWHGQFLTYATTAASMVGFVNSIVAGAGIALLLHRTLGAGFTGIAVATGVVVTVALVYAFVAYQSWRYRASPALDQRETGRRAE